MPDDRDIRILRGLAGQVAGIAAKDVQDRRRDLWSRHNSLQPTRPLVYVRCFACKQEIPEVGDLQCADPFFRRFEDTLRQMIFQDRLGDDFIIEPWIAVPAVYSAHTGPGRWGPEIRHSARTADRGSWAFEPAIKDEADLARLVPPRHAIDEQATQRDASRLHDAIGDLLTVCVDRVPCFRQWQQDISTDVAQLVGLEPFMLAMVDRPEWLHRLLAFMRDGILRVHEQAEQAGDWGLCNHINQSMPYALELPRPAADGHGTPRSQLWTFMASQETTLVSPAMFDEFILQYQIPITAPFGLSAYGCCENLTRKIDVLRKIPNLRRIAATPWADLASCVEQIGTDYVISWRPSPAEMICRGFDPARVRRLIREGLDTCRGTHVDICLKDVETIASRPDNLIEWTRIVMGMVEEYGG